MKMLTLVCTIAVIAVAFAKVAHASHESVEVRAIRAAFPNYIENKAIKVAACESTGGRYPYRWAANPSGATGMFQILPSHLVAWGWALTYSEARRMLFNPWINARAAARLWYGSGKSFYTDWIASARCWA